MMMLAETSKVCEEAGERAGICCNTTIRRTWEELGRFASVLLPPPSAIIVPQSLSFSSSRQIG